MALLTSNPQALGLLGLSLLTGANDPNQSFGSLLFNAAKNINATNQNTNSADNYNPYPPTPMQMQAQAISSTPTSPYALPANKADILQTLKQNAAQIYPDNPNMQQVAITQALLESNLLNKPSDLASKNFNLFGIKSAGTNGTVNLPTTEFSNGNAGQVNANFGSNNSIADSFAQYRNLLGAKRYQPVLAAQTPTDAFGALQRAGYATDPNYANKLSSVYNRFVAPLYQS
jgi:flagellum-specific peptidoglycan hydrolase FlgJ